MNDIPRVIEYFYSVHCAMYINLLIRCHQVVHIGKLHKNNCFCFYVEIFSE